MVLTFDTNCLIQLENSEPEATFLQSLTALNEQGKLVIQVPAISASEVPQKGQAPRIHYFIERLRKVGLSKCKVLPTIGYWDITFYEYTVWATQGSVKLERRIHEILFPTIECDYADYRKRVEEGQAGDSIHRKWLNAKCDVAAMWCHLKHQGDIFVTSDRNFHKPSRKQALINLGAKEIHTPLGTFERLRALGFQ